MDIRTAKFTENEIAKSEDFNFLSSSTLDNIIEIIKKVIGVTANDCIVHGLEVRQCTPVSMNVEITGGLALLSNGSAVYLDTVSSPLPIENGDAYDRIDTLQIRKKNIDFDTKQRAFKDPGTGTVTYVDVATKTLFGIEVKVIKGVPGAGNAPNAEAGWIKLAEILVPAGTTSGILNTYIRNVTAYLSNLTNSNWTAEQNRTWKAKNYTTLINAFKNKHADNGDHKDDVIKDQHIDWGTGAEQIFAGRIPVANEGNLFGAFNVERALQDTYLKGEELATIRQKSTGIMVPMYFYPWSGGGWSSQFETLLDLLKKYQSVPAIVIINPSNGPGTVEDGVWRRAIKKLVGSGAQVAGYIYTQYGNRSLSAVYADIDQWRALYPLVRSLFLDEMTNDNDQNHINYYKQVTEYAHRKGFYPVIGNPGSPTYETYFTQNAADNIIIFENSYWPDENTLKGGDWEDSYREISPYRRSALIHSISSLNITNLEMIRKYVGFLYVTNDVMPNPWDSLPNYFSNVLSFLNTTNSMIGSNVSVLSQDGLYLSDEGNVVNGLTNPMRIYTAGLGSNKYGIISQSNLLRIMSPTFSVDGNTALGILDPAGYRLRVSGTQYIDNNLYVIGNTALGLVDPAGYRLRVFGNQYVDQNLFVIGNLGVGITDTAGYKLRVQGNMYTNQSIIAGDSVMIRTTNNEGYALNVNGYAKLASELYTEYIARNFSTLNTTSNHIHFEIYHPVMIFIQAYMTNGANFYFFHMANQVQGVIYSIIGGGWARYIGALLPGKYRLSFGTCINFYLSTFGWYSCPNNIAIVYESYT